METLKHQIKAVLTAKFDKRGVTVVDLKSSYRELFGRKLEDVSILNMCSKIYGPLPFTCVFLQNNDANF